MNVLARRDQTTTVAERRPSSLSRRDVGLGLVAAALLPWRAAAETSAPLPVVDLANLYAPDGVGRTRFAAQVEGLAGRLVAVEGYRLPHLRPGAGFTCVAATPATSCPHCRDEMFTIPWDMVVWYPAETEVSSDPQIPVRVVGTLELGARRDPQTGFVSTVRLRGRTPPAA